jgi:uncharacterized protein (DUF2235 family)
MAKNIVVLSDGTGNSAAKLWKTNVWRLYQALDLADGKQIARYDDGVGTSSFKPVAVLGGALGYGLKRNVIALYCFLCRHYKDGDQIYAFGFSRGAFTIRVLAAMVTSQGLVPWTGSESELQRNAKAAYRSYRYGYGTLNNLILVWPLRKLRDGIVALRNALRGHEPYGSVRERNAKPKIHFLGLWDTVDAYGLPLYEMTRAVHLFFWPLAFPNRDLSDRVNRACHALAIDDERTTFHPLLWNEDKEPQVGSIQKEKLSQVWFAGMHSNVGGGYPDDAMANVPLKWIMGEAERSGLQFKAKPNAAEEIESDENLRGRMYDSRHGTGGYFRYGPRKIEYLCDDRIDHVFVKRPKIHESVLERIKTGTDGYAPIVLPANYALVRADGKIVEDKANPYEQRRLAQWRAIAQEKVWDVVWAKRVVYFLTLSATAYLVALPCLNSDVCRPVGAVFDPLFRWSPGLKGTIDAILRAPETAFNNLYALMGGSSGTVGRYLEPKINAYVPMALDGVKGFLPGLVSPWIDALAKVPGKVTVALVVVILFTLAGAALQRRIFEKMRKVWHPVMAAGPAAVPDADAKMGILSRTRTSRFYRRIILALRRTIIPVLFALLYFYLIWFVLSWLWGAVTK